MIRDTRLILILIFGSMGVGILWTLLGMMEELLEPFDVENVSVGIIGMIFVLSGLFAGLCCSFWVRRVNRLDAPLRLMLLLAVIGMLGI